MINSLCGKAQSVTLSGLQNQIQKVHTRAAETHKTQGSDGAYLSNHHKKKLKIN